MGLLQEIQDAVWKRSDFCLFGEFIGSLSAADQEDVRNALTDRTISAHAIYVACRNNGFTGGDSIIRRHRRKECICL